MAKNKPKNVLQKKDNFPAILELFLMMYRSQLVPRDIECLCKPISCDDPLKMATRGDDFSRACLAKGRLKFPKASKMSTDYVFLLMQLLSSFYPQWMIAL